MQQAGCASRLIPGEDLPTDSLSGRPGIQKCQTLSVVTKPPDPEGLIAIPPNNPRRRSAFLRQ